jgi:hypothetical protein
MKNALIVCFFLAAACHAQVRATAPDAVIRGTLAALTSEGLVQANDVDKTWSEEIASQKLSRDTSRKVFLVEFQLHSGGKIRAVANWNVSAMPEQSGLIVYVVSQILQPDGKPTPPQHR